jgi:hypothetical protein
MENEMTKIGTAGLALASILAVSAASVTDASAQWRRHNGWGPAVGIGAGIAAGALIGSAVAARPYGYGGYYYDEPVYAAPYAYDAGPTFYSAPVYGNYGYNSYGYSSNRCQEGYRRVACVQGGGY